MKFLIDPEWADLAEDLSASRFIWHIPGGNGWHCTWRAWGVWK